MRRFNLKELDSWACRGAACALAMLLAAPVSAQVAARDLSDLQSGIRTTLRQARVPGASIVVIEGGRVVLAFDHGVADQATARPVRPDTVFRAGSISKSFTGLATMVLVERGKLDLDAPLAQLLPQWEHRNPWAATHPVRLVHLLEHAAGLDDVRFRHYLLNSASMPIEEAVVAFGPYAVRWRPGSGTSYSNAGPIVAGLAIERAAGTSFAQFVGGAITGPLDMRSARWTWSADFADQLSKSYSSDLRTPEPFVDTPARPSGSLNVTARDLAKLPLLLLGRGALDGVRVLSPQSVDRLEAPRSRIVEGAGASTRLPLGWGLGLQANAQGRAVFYGHDGSIDGFVSRFAYSPSLGAGYVVMANALSDAPMAAAQQIRTYLERDLPVANGGVRPLSAEQRAAWEGQYQSTTPRQELLRAILGLTQWEGAKFDGDVLRYSGKRWFHAGEGVFRAEGAVAPELAFSGPPLASGGAADTLAHTPDGSRRRVPGWEATLKLGGVAATVVALGISLVSLPFWVWAAWRGRWSGAGSVATHLRLRLIHTLALWLAVAIPLGVLGLLGTRDLAWLGAPTAVGWALAGFGVLAPGVWLIAVLALARRGRSAGLKRVAWFHAGSNLCLALLVMGWLGWHGWLGMRIWQ